MLDSRIAGLPYPERQRVMEYYNEIILDGVENGKSEQEVIDGLGDVEDIAAKTIAEYAGAEPEKKNGLSAGKIVLWVCAAPFLLAIGLPLLAAAFVLYLCVWILIACFYIVSASLALSGICALLGTAFILFKNPVAALLQVGTGVLCLGLCLLSFVGSLALTKQFVRFTAYMTKGLSARFRKGDVHNEA